MKFKNKAAAVMVCTGITVASVATGTALAATTPAEKVETYAGAETPDRLADILNEMVEDGKLDESVLDEIKQYIREKTPEKTKPAEHGDSKAPAKGEDQAAESTGKNRLAQREESNVQSRMSEQRPQSDQRPEFDQVPDLKQGDRFDNGWTPDDRAPYGWGAQDGKGQTAPDFGMERGGRRGWNADANNRFGGVQKEQGAGRSPSSGRFGADSNGNKDGAGAGRQENNGKPGSAYQGMPKS